MTQKANKEYLIFLTKYIGIIVIYYLIIVIPNNFILNFFLEFLAHLSSFLLNLFGLVTSVHQDIITNSIFSVQISFGCEGTEPMMLYTAGLLAYKSPIKKKLYWILVGNIFLVIANVIRISLLFTIGYNKPEIFEDFHVTYFPILMLLFSVTLFLLWIKFAKK